jgi:hypothetical protein
MAERVAGSSFFKSSLAVLFNFRVKKEGGCLTEIP